MVRYRIVHNNLNAEEEHVEVYYCRLDSTRLHTTQTDEIHYLRQTDEDLPCTLLHSSRRQTDESLTLVTRNSAKMMGRSSTREPSPKPKPKPSASHGSGSTIHNIIINSSIPYSSRPRQQQWPTSTMGDAPPTNKFDKRWKS